MIGWLHEMQQLDHDRALEFYRTWYAPNNAILVVAGDIDAAELRPLAERTYGRLQPTPQFAARAIGRRIRRRADRCALPIAMKKCAQPSLSRLYPAVSYTTDARTQRTRSMWRWKFLAARRPAGSIARFGDRPASAVSAGASADTVGIGGGSFTLCATPAEGVSLESAGSGDGRGGAPIPARWPDTGRTHAREIQLAAAAIYARDDTRALANMYGASLAQGESMDQIVNWPDDIEAVTRDSALAALRATLNLNDSVTGYLLPPETAPMKCACGARFCVCVLCGAARFAQRGHTRRGARASRRRRCIASFRRAALRPGWFVEDHTVPMIVLCGLLARRFGDRAAGA